MGKTADLSRPLHGRGFKKVTYIKLIRSSVKLVVAGKKWA